MVICRTPFRISFFGGGTDYPDWYRKNGGEVLSTSINHYSYVSCRSLPPFHKHKFRIVYSIIEDVQDVAEIRHPLIRECLKLLSVADGMEIHYSADLPKQTGLGTSSSFAVGLLQALHALRKELLAPLDLAREAIHIERDRCRENVGSQDQVAAAVGGFNHLTFDQDDTVGVRPVSADPARMEQLEERLMLFYSGISRFASTIAADQIAAIPQSQAALREMQMMVPAAAAVLTGPGDLAAFGEMLHESWQLKRSLTSRISTGEIDALYDAARRAGAVGGKLCGAGGGGFLLLYVEPENQPAVREALQGCLHVPFGFEPRGSEIIFNRP